MYFVYSSCEKRYTRKKTRVRGRNEKRPPIMFWQQFLLYDHTILGDILCGSLLLRVRVVVVVVVYTVDNTYMLSFSTTNKTKWKFYFYFYFSRLMENCSCSPDNNILYQKHFYRFSRVVVVNPIF